MPNDNAKDANRGADGKVSTMNEWFQFAKGSGKYPPKGKRIHRKILSPDLQKDCWMDWGLDGFRLRCRRCSEGKPRGTFDRADDLIEILASTIRQSYQRIGADMAALWVLSHAFLSGLWCSFAR